MAGGKTSAPRAEAPTKPGRQPMDRLAAEARRQVEDDGSTTAYLCGELVHIKPFGEWTSSAIDAQDRGNYRLWAQQCLGGTDFLIWERLDPTVTQIMDFFASWMTRTGEDLGESAAS